MVETRFQKWSTKEVSILISKQSQSSFWYFFHNGISGQPRVLKVVNGRAKSWKMNHCVLMLAQWLLIGGYSCRIQVFEVQHSFSLGKTELRIKCWNVFMGISDKWILSLLAPKRTLGLPAHSSGFSMKPLPVFPVYQVCSSSGGEY